MHLNREKRGGNQKEGKRSASVRNGFNNTSLTQLGSGTEEGEKNSIVKRSLAHRVHMRFSTDDSALDFCRELVFVFVVEFVRPIGLVCTRG